MNDDDLRRLGKSIISQILRRGGNDNLRPRVEGDSITVDYRTDCDRAGDVENSQGGFMVGFTLEERQKTVAFMKEELGRP